MLIKINRKKLIGDKDMICLKCKSSRYTYPIEILAEIPPHISELCFRTSNLEINQQLSKILQ